MDIDPQYKYWHDSLKGLKPEIHADRPQSGFYWAKAGKLGGRIPVALATKESGETVLFWGTAKNGQKLGYEDACRLWTRFADKPVRREEWRLAWEKGEWEDKTPCHEPEPTIGHNSSRNPYDALRELCDDKMESARRLIAEQASKDPSKVAADRAHNLVNELREIVKEATKLHREEKDPLMEQVKDVDNRYRFRDDVKTVAEQLKDIETAFALAERRRKQEEALAERRRQEAEARAIEIARREREKALRPSAAPEDPPAEPEPPAPEPTIADIKVDKVMVGGGIGRRGSLRTMYYAEITDWNAAIAHYSACESVREAVQKLANADVKLHKNGTSIPGVSVRTEERVV